MAWRRKPDADHDAGRRIKKERPTIDVAPIDLVALMQRCWAHEPDARPDFATIKAGATRVGPETAK